MVMKKTSKSVDSFKQRNAEYSNYFPYIYYVDLRMGSTNLRIHENTIFRRPRILVTTVLHLHVGISCPSYM